MSPSFRSGLDMLLARGGLSGRIGLVSHAAALTADGASAADALARLPGVTLAALFAPEHGFFGAAGPGAPVRTLRHPFWKIPVHSLYGPRLAPPPALLRKLDLLVIDLQDLGARCYTYVSTLRHTLEAAAAAGTPVLVADRPIPLPVRPDGPPLEPGFESFVGAAPLPLAYALTPGEAALFLKKALGLPLDLRIARMAGWPRAARRGPDWPPWAPPSPGIRSWESAACYLATVFTEAVPALSCGRTTTLPFQLLGAPWLNVPALLDALRADALPGVAFHPHPFIPPSDPYAGRLLPGLRLTVTEPARFKPVLTSVALLAALQRLHGRRRLWNAPGARPAFFDKLYGGNRTRLALLDGASAAEVAGLWAPSLTAFARARREVLLYRP